MKKEVGVVGFSFGLRSEEEEPNPSNQVLAEAVARACEYVSTSGSHPVVVTQWEITKGLASLVVEVEHSVELRADGTYLDSDMVWEEAKALFEDQWIDQMIIIAQPFLHMTALRRMARKDGFEVLDFPVGKVPFDNSSQNTQPWTRSRLALALYAVKSLLGMKPGHDGMQHAQP